MCCFKCLVGCLDKPKKNKKVNQNGYGGNANVPAGSHKQDPVDKAVSGLLGNKVKPQYVEKMTDGARGMFEKKTGHKVPGFISN